MRLNVTSDASPLGPKRKSPAERLWRYVTKTDGCWIWTGYKNNKGYGLLHAGSQCAGTRRMLLVHRLSYEIHFGEFPQDALICHRCDVPACVNPDHLFIGTDHDNIVDSVKKNRWGDRARRGAAHHAARLDAGTARLIQFQYLDGGLTKRALAAKHGVHTSTITKIIDGSHWSLR